MYRSSAKGLNALLVSVAACLLLASSALYGVENTEKKSAPKVAPQVIFPKASKVTGLRPLRSHLKRPVPGATRKEIPIQPLKRANPDYTAQGPALPRTSPAPAIPDPLLTFEGVGDVNFVQPADTTLAIGPAHVFQWVNLSAQIFDKDGNDLSGGPFDGTAFWQDLGGDCATINGGDIIVIYDHLADRWIATQLAAAIQGASTNNVCWAVSTSNDPLGTYNQYAFEYSPTDLNDYPKWALWPDAYYGTFRNFVNASFFGGMVVWAVDRNALLAGDPNPTILQVNVGEVLPSLDGLLAANLSPGDPGPPAARTGGSVAPETLFGVSNPGLDGDPSSIRIFQFHPDFGNPPASTFTGPVDLAVTDFTASTGAVEQPAPGGTLEDLPWIMYKADYRNFGTYEGVVLTHTEDVGGGQIGVRWYEVRDPNGTPELYQEGTFAPDSSNRWFPSIAQDVSGDIAVGYSVADGSIFPSIRYAGRKPDDPLGQLAQGEGEFFAGNGPFGGFRWGDYSTISLDPVDQCTFWYTTMYVPGSGVSDWSTGIGSFKFDTCHAGPAGTISGTVTDGTNPIPGVKVKAGTPSATTDDSGAYQLSLPVGVYDLTASKYGWLPASANGVEVTEDNDTIQNFTLKVAPSIEVNGTVKDGSGGGWPLYANIKITAPGAPTFNIQTNPVNGYYSIVLVQGITYTFQITAVGPGYLPGGGTVDLSFPPVTPGGVVKNWELLVDAQTCSAPGYTLNIDGLQEDFEGGELPAGWDITNNSKDGGGQWFITNGGDPCGHGQFDGNLTGGTGYYALVDSDCDGFVTDDTSLITSSVDMSSFSSAAIRFNTDYRHYNPSGDIADVDVSTDGGTSWTNVWEKTADARGPRVESVDITSLAAGQADVKARFHYYNAFFAWWWQVDNVALGQVTCDVGAGGLVVGKVTSLATGLGLNGATVKNLPDDAETLTFHSAGEGDGFYILFAPSGTQPFRGLAGALRLGAEEHARRAQRDPASRLRAALRRSRGESASALRPGGSGRRHGRADAQHDQHRVGAGKRSPSAELDKPPVRRCRGAPAVRRHGEGRGGARPRSGANRRDRTESTAVFRRFRARRNARPRRRPAASSRPIPPTSRTAGVPLRTPTAARSGSPTSGRGRRRRSRLRVRRRGRHADGQHDRLTLHRSDSSRPTGPTTAGTGWSGASDVRRPTPASTSSTRQPCFDRQEDLSGLQTSAARSRVRPRDRHVLLGGFLERRRHRALRHDRRHPRLRLRGPAGLGPRLRPADRQPLRHAERRRRLDVWIMDAATYSTSSPRSRSGANGFPGHQPFGGARHGLPTATATCGSSTRTGRRSTRWPRRTSNCVRQRDSVALRGSDGRHGRSRVCPRGRGQHASGHRHLRFRRA